MELREIPLVVIDTDKSQPRKDFDLTEIKESIHENGVLIPILVQPTSHGGWADYIILDGERRFRASKELGLKTIPAVINHQRRKDRLKDQVIIDHQRHSLSVEEKSKGWLKLLEQYDGNHEEVAKSVGVSVNQVKNVIEGMQFKERVKDQLPEDLGRRERAIIRRTNRIKDDNLRAKLVIKAVESDEPNDLIDEKVKFLGQKNLDDSKLTLAEQKIILNARDIDEAIITIRNMRREAGSSGKPKESPKTEANPDEKSATLPQKEYNCPNCNGTMANDRDIKGKISAILSDEFKLAYSCKGCHSLFILSD